MPGCEAGSCAGPRPAEPLWDSWLTRTSMVSHGDPIVLLVISYLGAENTVLPSLSLSMIWDSFS
jgi:hypothetical protein